MLPANFLATFKDQNTFGPVAKIWLNWQRSGRNQFMQNFRSLLQGGVSVIAGTDAVNLGTFQGYSLHRELELMVLSGASNQEALRAATTNACAFLGEDCSLAEGAKADLLITEKSPLDNIANTQTIAYVLYRGEIVDRKALKDQFQKAPVLLAPPKTGGANVPCAHF